jgi:rubredoxin
VTSLYNDAAERNFRLLVGLAKQMGAKDFGAISNFFEVDVEWRCPCCYRAKPEIARLDKNQNLLCSIHEHHDHFWDELGEKVPLFDVHYPARQAIGDSFARFPPTRICSDCNVAEPDAKRLVGAPSYFTFAPYEIASFIIVSENSPHTVNEMVAVSVYEAAKPAMKLMARRLTAVTAASKSNGETFEPIGAAAWRVMQSARKRKDP